MTDEAVTVELLERWLKQAYIDYDRTVEKLMVHESLLQKYREEVDDLYANIEGLKDAIEAKRGTLI